MSDVVIVGAGAAGLTAAYFLQQANLTVTVLEASSIFGGRVKKDSRLGEDLDIGANFIPTSLEGFSTPKSLLEDVFERELNVDTVPMETDILTWISGLEMFMNETNDGYWSSWVSSTWWDFFNDEVVSKLSDGTIVYDCPVSTIDYSGDATVTTCGDRSYESSKVIVTVSMKILQDGDISFVPELPSEYSTHFSNVQMGPAITTYFKFSEPFFGSQWTYLDYDFYLYNMENDTAPDYGYKVFWDENFGKDDSAFNILCLSLEGTAAEEYMELNDTELILSALDELDVMYNYSASDLLEEAFVFNWALDPYTRTAYTINIVDKDATLALLRTPIEDKIYFAGESIPDPNDESALVTGAARSGKRAANQIIIGPTPAPTTLAPTPLAPTKMPTPKQDENPVGCGIGTIVEPKSSAEKRFIGRMLVAVSLLWAMAF